MSAFAARYARAFSSVVLESKLDAQKVQQQLNDFSQTLAGSKDLREALMSPAIPLAQRIAVLDAVSQRAGIDRQVRNFLAVLTEHNRIGALDEVLAQYHQEMDRRLSVSEAEIVSARKLEDGERADLEKQAGALAGNAVHVTFREDGSLIGGVVIRIGSMLYDGSVRGRLDRLRDQLVAD